MDHVKLVFLSLRSAAFTLLASSLTKFSFMIATAFLLYRDKLLMKNYLYKIVPRRNYTYGLNIYSKYSVSANFLRSASTDAVLLTVPIAY